MGIDVGGTFTDFAYLNDEGRIEFSKVLTTYPPDGGVQKGLSELTTDLSGFSFLSHSTTLGLNAYITGTGAKTGLISTEGFRDTLEIARTRRLLLYDLFQEKPEKVLVPRRLRLEVKERLDKDGNVVIPLNLKEVVERARALKSAGVEAIAVSLIHSYANPAHEKEIAEILKKECPEAFLSISSEILPEFREYERVFATVMNAYIGPIMAKYLDITERIFSKAGYSGEIYISQSNGGLMSTRVARNKPVYTLGSGPASGVMGGLFVGKLGNYQKIITLDMGGTTCLVSLVEETPQIVSETTLENRLKLPMIDVRTIGAGGGSIAWVDKQGAFHVGPQSAAANPGPACYGQGGKEATVTDANLFLGYLDSKYYLGGRMKVYPDKSKEALLSLADQLGIDVQECAASIKKIVEANMVNNISEASTWRGYDPREFTLVAFGGGAGLHCVNMAMELGIKSVVSPPYPAIVSALGHIVSDIKHFYSTTYVTLVDEANLDTITQFFDTAEGEAAETLSRERASTHVRNIRSVDMRYSMQSHELNVMITNRALNEADILALNDRFHAKHEETYGYSLRERKVEIATLRLQAIGESGKVKLREETLVKEGSPASAARPSRNAYMPESGVTKIQVYDRERLKPGALVEGPSLIDGLEATLFVPPDWKGVVDGYHNLILSN